MNEFLKDNMRVFVVPVDLLDREDLTTHEKMVYVVLRSFANPHTNQVFPSYATIARLASMKRRATINCISSLIEKGLLIKEHQFNFVNGEARNKNNLYTLQTPKVSASGAPPSASGAPHLVHQVHHPSASGAPPSASNAPYQDHLTSPYNIKEIDDDREQNLAFDSGVKTEGENMLTDQQQADIFDVLKAVKDKPGFKSELFKICVERVVIRSKLKPIPNFKGYLLKVIETELENQTKQDTQPKPAAAARSGSSRKPKLSIIDPPKSKPLSEEEKAKIFEKARKMDEGTAVAADFE